MIDLEVKGHLNAEFNVRYPILARRDNQLAGAPVTYTTTGGVGHCRNCRSCSSQEVSTSLRKEAQVRETTWHARGGTNWHQLCSSTTLRKTGNLGQARTLTKEWSQSS